MVWEPRDELVSVAIRYGLNARQISELTLSTPQPLTTTQGVYDLIAARGWGRLYESAQARHRRRDWHDRQLNVVWQKLVGQALEYGLDVGDFLRNESPAYGLRFRPDLGLQLGTRHFYAELQLSKLEYIRWHVKMRHYVKLYALVKRPFRVLFVIARERDVAKVREYARLVLAGRPALNLFYAVTMERFARERDVVKAPVWTPTWGDGPVALL